MLCWISGDVVTIGVLLDHTSHAELWSASANGFFHRLSPVMRYAVSATIEIAWNNLLFQNLVEGKTISLVLCFLIVVFALLLQSPIRWSRCILQPTNHPECCN